MTGERIGKSVVWAGVATLLVGLTLTFAIAWHVARTNRDATDVAVTEAANGIAESVIARMNLYQYGLRGARGALLVAGNRDDGREHFKLYSASRDTDQEFHGARGFGFIRRVPRDQEASFLERARADGKPDFAIRELSPNEGERYVIQYIEPVERNAPAVGLDIASERNRRVAALDALTSGETRLTGPITLVQASGSPQQSFLILTPVYEGGATPATEAERLKSGYGWSYAPLLMSEVLADLPFDAAATHLVLSDVTDAAQPTIFFESTRDEVAGGDLHSHVTEREIFGRRWQVSFSVRPPFVQGLHQQSPTTTILAGGLISALLAALAGALRVGQERRQQVLSQKFRLASVVESSADGIIAKTLDGRVESWNRGATDIFGYEASEAIGRPLHELIVPPALVAEEQGLLQKVAAGEHVRDFETQRHRRDGTILFVSVTISPIRGSDGNIIGASKTVRDISPQKAAEAEILSLNANLEQQVLQRTEELIRVNALFSSVLHSASEIAIIATDRDGLITLFNRGAERLLGYRESEMVGKATPAMIHLESEVTARSAELSAECGQLIDGFRTFVYKAARDGAESRDWTYVRKDGSHVPVCLVVTAIRDDFGQLIGFLGMAQDITTQRELETRLWQAKEQADAANAAKSRFLANISHEIRSPMNAVLGMMHLLQRTSLTRYQQDYLSKSIGAANTLLRLLNDLLDYSKIEADKMVLELQPFTLEQVMHDLGVVLSSGQGSKEVEIVFDLDPQLPSQVVGDSLRLQQILTNLGNNALKFTASGQVVVGIAVLTQTNDTVTLRFSVYDTGIGISPHHHEQIFEAFSQAETSTTRRFGGTGLGLGICRRLVELMDSRLTLESDYGKGSRFSFDLRLPLGPAALSVPEGIPHQQHGHVLVVDDNPFARDLAVRAMQQHGWAVEAASGAVQAFDRLAEAEQKGTPFDLILLDWQMPGTDGLDAACRIRGEVKVSRQPAIVLIADYGHETLLELQQQAKQPFAGILAKPFTPLQLHDAAISALNDAQAPAKAPKRVAASQRLSGLRVLVVEDNGLNREVAASLLTAEGAEVFLAESGAEGVKLAARDSPKLDLVLMDIQMPGMDGLEATRRIRAEASCAMLPIIAMTANASGADRDACLLAGMNDHLGKPFDLDKLVTAVLMHTGGAATAKTAGDTLQAPTGAFVEEHKSVLRRFGNDAAMYAKLFERFRPAQEELLQRLRSHVAGGDTEAAANVLHAIKGSAGTMGAAGLSVRAGEWEAALRAAEPEAASTLLAQVDINDLSRALTASLAALQASTWPITPSECERCSHGLANKEWCARMRELAQLIGAGNLRAIEFAESIWGELDAVQRCRFRTVLEPVNALDFALAETALKRLLEAG